VKTLWPEMARFVSVEHTEIAQYTKVMSTCLIDI
jgi:hypothetical protein